MRASSVVGFAVAVLVLAGCGEASPHPPALSSSGGGTGSGAGSSSASGGASSGSASGSGSGSASGSGSGSTGSTSTGSGASTTSGSGSSGSAGGFTVAGTLGDAVSTAPLAGAAVCLLGSSTSCVTTDASGAFSIAGLTATGSGITATTTGYVPGIWSFSLTSDVGSLTVFLRSAMRMTNLATQAGVAWDGAAGAIHFLTRDGAGNSLAGVSIATSGGGRVAYFDDSGNLDANLTATTAGGEGFVFGLPAGTMGVTFSAPGRTCNHSGSDGWAPPAAGETESVPIQTGHVTLATGACQ